MQEHNLSQSRPAGEAEQGALYEWITFFTIHLLYVPGSNLKVKFSLLNFRFRRIYVYSS